MKEQMKKTKGKLLSIILIILMQLIIGNGYSQEMSCLNNSDCCSLYNFVFTATPVSSGSSTYSFQIQSPLSQAVSCAEGKSDGFTLASVSWDFGDGSTIFSGLNPSHTYSLNGVCASNVFNVKVCLTIIPTFGENELPAITCSKEQIVVIQNININSTHTIVASGGTCGHYTFNYTGSTLSNAQWAFGDGTFAVATTTTISHTYPANGMYTVTLTGDEISPCAVVTTVSVTDFPDLNFTYIASNPCNLAAGITINISNYNILNSYLLNINGTIQPISASGSYTNGLIAGTNIIKVSATTPNGCYSEVSKVVNLGVPEATFSLSSQNVCVGADLTSVVSGVNYGGESYTWTITKTGGTPVTIIGAIPSYFFNSAGTYSVILTITNSYYNPANPGTPQICTSVTSPAQTITVNDHPSAIFSINSSNICSGQVMLIFPSTSSGMTSYTINYGDGTPPITGTTTFPTSPHQYINNGVYNITLTVQNGACSETDNHNVNITNNITASIVASSSYLCQGSSVSLTAVLNPIPSGTITYDWTGPNTSSTQSQINISEAGTYSLTVDLAANGSCPAISLTQTKTIIALANPTASPIGNPTLDCSGATTTFANLEISQALALQGFCINGVCTAANPVAPGPPAINTAIVSGLVEGDNYITIANGLNSSCTGTLLVHIDKNVPVISLSMTQPESCGSTGSASVTQTTGVKWYRVTDYPSANVIQTNGNSGLDPGKYYSGPSISGLAPGSYVVEVKDGNCTVTKYFDIIAPTINLSVANNNLGTCISSPIEVIINVQTTESGLSYDWKKKNSSNVFVSLTGMTNSNTNNLTPGNYQVIVSSGDCSSTITFEVIELDPIVVSFDIDNPNCKNSGSILALTSGGNSNYNYTWTIGGITQANSTTNPSIDLSTLTLPTSVQVLVTDGSGCSATFPIDDPQQITAPDPVTLDNCGGVDVPNHAVKLTGCDLSVCVLGGTAPYNLEWYRIGPTTSHVEHLFFLEDIVNNDPSDLIPDGSPGADGIADMPLIIREKDVTNGNYIALAIPADQAAVDADNSDNDPATYYYPQWDFSGTPTPKLNLQNEPYPFSEIITNPTSETYVTAYTGLTTSNIADFITGDYKLNVTDANGCTYSFSIGNLNFDPPTIFSVQFDYVWGLNKKEEPPIVESQKVDENLAQDMAEAAAEMLDEAGKCMAQQAQQLASLIKTDCFKLDDFRDVFSLAYDITEHHYTLYYYDRAGQLTKTVPPQGFVEYAHINELKQYRIDGVASNMPDPVIDPDPEINDPNPYSPNHRMLTTYQYNSLGQLISQNTPDGGTSNFIYDGKSRLRFSQNAQQSADGKYSYTKYDELGRIIEVGESSLSGLDFTNLGLAANLTAANSTNSLHINDFPATNNSQITNTVYSVPAPSSVTYYGKPQRYLQNRISYVYIDNDPATSGNEYYTYYSYDSHGNVEWLIQEDPQLGKNYIAYEYDLISGKVLKVNYNENRMDRFFHRYSYDEQNKLTKVETSRNGDLWDADASYKYYPHGPLQRIGLGEDHVQGLDNIYTIQGWLKSINTPHLIGADDPGQDIGTPATVAAGLPWNTQNVAQDRFGMILNYYKGDYTRTGSFLNSGQGASASTNVDDPNNLYAQTTTPTSTNSPDLYNGNISSWVHSQLDGPLGQNPLGPNAARVDLFKYDVLNRIKQSIDLQKNGTSWGVIGAGVNAMDAYKTAYSYDANGNILNLDRYDEVGNQMDKLAYTYSAPLNSGVLQTNPIGDPAFQNNKLSAVNEDAGIISVGGRGDLEGVHTYQYDKIGNLIHDVSPERFDIGNNNYAQYNVTTDINWTVYGKIKEIFKSTDFAGTPHNERITFSYDASGNRTKKEYWKDRGTCDNIENDEEIATTLYVRDAQGNIMSVYTKAYDETNQLYQYKLTEQPLYGSDRIGQNVKEIVLSEATTLGALLPPTDGINTISEYQNWITSTNKTSLLPGGNEKLCECKIKSLSGTDYNTVNTTAEFLGVAENGVAVAENLDKQLQFYVVLVEKYLGNNDVCLVYDKSGKLMKGTDLITGVDVKSKPIITNIPGTNKYAVVTLNNNKLPVYHVVDMDEAGYGIGPDNAGKVISNDLPMSNNAANSTASHGLHFTAYEDHINGKSIVYNTRYTPDPIDPIDGKTEILSYDFNSDYNIQPQEHVMYEINGCGNTETGELQISPQGDKLAWYQHDENISGFDYRLADIYSFALSADKTAILGTVDYTPGATDSPKTSPAGNYGEGRVEFMKNNQSLLYSQRGLYKEGTGVGNDKNTWKYEKISGVNIISAINPATIFNPANLIDPTITYLFSEIRRGINGNYYMPNMGTVADKIHSYDGSVWNDDLSLNEANYQLSSSLPTQVFKLFADPNQVITDYGRNIGNKQYELKDHLGNVSVVISDVKIGNDDGDYDNNNDGINDVSNAISNTSDGIVDHFIPTILSFTDYYPFGAEMPGRSFQSSNKYRYGFNGKENDNEVKGNGNQQDYGMRIYDPRLGKFLSVDPLTSKFAFYSPYHFAGNSPIWCIDLDGEEPKPSTSAEQITHPDPLTPTHEYSSGQVIWKVDGYWVSVNNNYSNPNMDRFYYYEPKVEKGQRWKEFSPKTEQQLGKEKLAGTMAAIDGLENVIIGAGIAPVAMLVLPELTIIAPMAASSSEMFMFTQGLKITNELGAQLYNNGMNFRDVDYWDVLSSGTFAFGFDKFSSGAIDWKPFSLDENQKFRTVFNGTKGLGETAFDTGAKLLFGKIGKPGSKFIENSVGAGTGFLFDMYYKPITKKITKEVKKQVFGH